MRVIKVGSEHNVSFHSTRGRTVTLRIAANGDVVDVWPASVKSIGQDTIEAAQEAVKRYEVS